jgi:hypothetical protein
MDEKQGDSDPQRGILEESRLESQISDLKGTEKKKATTFLDKIMNGELEIGSSKALLIGLILFALGLRLYFYFQYGGQAFWYDEADYFLRAKAIAFNLDWASFASRKPVILPFFWSIFLWLGGNEMTLKLTEIFFSTCVVYVVYLLGKEAYNKYVGLMMGLFFAVYYFALFFSIRLLLGQGALLATVFAVYFFIKWYKKRDYKYIIFAAIATSLAIQIFYIPLYLVYMFVLFLMFTRPHTFYKDKHLWIAVLTVFLTFVPLMLYWYFAYGDPFFGFSQYFGTGNPHPEGLARDGLATNNGILGFLLVIPTSMYIPLFVACVIGLLRAVADIYLNAKNIIHRKTTEYDIDILFIFWLFLVPIALGVVIIHVEPRYMFPGLIPAYYFAATGLYFVWKIIQKYSKPIATIALIIFLVYVSYSHVMEGNQIIGYSSNSFQQERFAGHWLEDNLEEDETFLSCNQLAVLESYSGRHGYNFAINTTKAEEFVENYHPKYLVIDGYYIDCAYNYPNENPDKYKLVQAYFVDESQTQPIILIYEVLY